MFSYHLLKTSLWMVFQKLTSQSGSMRRAIDGPKPAVMFGTFCLLTGLLQLSSVAAHEYWVAPKQFQPVEGAPFTASLRVGRMMKGQELPFIEETFETFTLSRRGETEMVSGRNGDMPAASFQSALPGLNILAYHSEAAEILYDEWRVFQFYLETEGLTEIEGLHIKRGLPQSGFRESYRRYAKALMQVGPVGPGDVDASITAPLELVALQNPYAPDLSTLTVKLLRDGAPVPNRQIAVFRNDGEVVRSLVFTDAYGRADIAIEGGGSFLLNATDLQPSDEDSIAWESYWASLTFGLPIIDPPLHPLDPLTKSEMARAIQAIGRSGRATAQTRVSVLTLDEAEKATTLAWSPGLPPNRRAFAVLRNGDTTNEAVVDLTTGEVVRWTEKTGVQPAIQPAEWALAQRLTKEDSRWQAAMAARGFSDPSQLFCESLSVGRFASEPTPPRLLKTVCFDVSEATTNIYARPVEGVVATIDIDREQVVEFVDSGVVPVAQDEADFDEASVSELAAAMRPILIAAPQGWNFKRDRNLFEWGPWRFHLGFDQRFGPVLSLVDYLDGGASRRVLYQGHLSEVFVPYMDSGKGWYFRSYMDAGEFGVGAYASSLMPGLDCPQDAALIDAVLVTRLGAPSTRQRAMCVFERPAQSPLWRHWEALGNSHEGRHATELVVRSIPTVGNYDYVVDWVFTLAGEIVVQVGATGIDAVKGVSTSSMDQPGAADDTSSGMLVAPNLVAIHHDHFFSFRFDLDVDGARNTFRRRSLVAAEAQEGSPRTSIWRLEEVPFPFEAGVSLDAGPELWTVENVETRTQLGHSPAYQISIQSTARSLLAPDDWPQRRAGFSSETLWVTRHHTGQRFAAGPYPNQSSGGDGVTTYVDGENLPDEDVVAWATLGFHHLTRPEDWPILPTVRHELRLRPYGFFTQNPSLGVRRDFLDTGAGD